MTIEDYQNYPDDKLLIAHKAGRAYARKPQANDLDAFTIAAGMPADESDFFMAGYRGERRRMAGQLEDRSC